MDILGTQKSDVLFTVAFYLEDIQMEIDGNIRVFHKFLSHHARNDFNWPYLYKHAGLSISHLWRRFQSSQSSCGVLCFIPFKKDNSANNSAHEICTAYGSSDTTITHVRSWFKRFRAGNFDLKEEDSGGYPATTDTDLIKAILNENLRYSVREIANATNISETMVHNLLIRMGYVNRCEVVNNHWRRPAF